MDGIKESEENVRTHLNFRTRSNNKVKITKVEQWRYQQLHESTAAYGGTIFWKFNPEHLAEAHAREYK